MGKEQRYKRNNVKITWAGLRGSPGQEIATPHGRVEKKEKKKRK
jgi:hypothetical protein